MVKYKSALVGIVLSLLMAAIHLYLTPAFHFPDYDAQRFAYNIQQMASGNYKELFHHLAPVYQLSMLLVWWLYPTPEAWIVVLAFIYAYSCWLWAGFWSQQQGRWLIFFLLQLSPLLFYHAGSMQTTTFQWIGFVGWWWLSGQRHNAPTVTGKEVVWLSLCLTMEYKSLLWVSAIFLFYLPYAYKNKQLLCYIQRWTLLCVVPFALIFLGAALGVEWYRYPATWFSLLYRPDWVVHPPLLRHIDFYVNYFFEYEPLILAATFVFIIRLWKKPTSYTDTLHKLPIFIVIWMLIVIHFLPKAPRLSVIILFLGYTYLGQILEQSASTLIQLLVVVITVSIAAARLLPFASYPNPYMEVSQRLEACNNAQELHTTASLGVVLYLDQPIHIIEHFQGALVHRPLLIDDLAQVAMLFDKDRLLALRQKAKWSVPHPFLGFPLLHLEHAEFTGNSYRQAKAHAKEMMHSEPAIYFIADSAKACR